MQGWQAMHIHRHAQQVRDQCTAAGANAQTNCTPGAGAGQARLPGGVYEINPRLMVLLWHFKVVVAAKPQCPQQLPQ